jgi:hypothetical protein
MGQSSKSGRLWSIGVGLLLALSASACSERAAPKARDLGTEDAGALDEGVVDDASVDDAEVLLDAGSDASADAGADASTVDGGPIVGCGAAPPRFSGALCGPGGASCSILRDERVEGGHNRNDVPSIDVDAANVPAIVYSIAEGGFRGMYARRGAAGVWSVAATGFDLATGGFVFVRDTATVLAYDGAYHTDVYTLGAPGWGRGERLPTDQIISGLNVRTDQGGCLHTLGEPGSGMTAAGTTYLERDAAWTGTAVGSGVEVGPSALALAPSGEPHVVWTETSSGAIALRWSRGLTHSELVYTSAVGGFVARLGVVTQGGVEVPHVLFAAPLADGTTELRHATRAADGTWSVAVLKTGRLRGCDTPATDGATCLVDGIQLVPVAVVTSGSGDVRLFWASVHEYGTLTGTCSGGPPGPPRCGWSGTPTRDGTLVVATPGGSSSDVGLGGDLLNATAVVDGLGFVHIAAYDLLTSGSGPGVRYLMVGAPL